MRRQWCDHDHIIFNSRVPLTYIVTRYDTILQLSQNELNISNLPLRLFIMNSVLVILDYHDYDIYHSQPPALSYSL